VRLPTPPEIADAPELAALESADHALELVYRSLVAANPELVDQEPRAAAEPPPLLELASDLIHRAAALQALIALYVEQLDSDRLSGFDDVTF